MAKLFANSGDPDQTPCSVASGLGLHCLPITLLGFPRLQWVNNNVNVTLKLIYRIVLVCPLGTRSRSVKFQRTPDKKLFRGLLIRNYSEDS